MTPLQLMFSADRDAVASVLVGGLFAFLFLLAAPVQAQQFGPQQVSAMPTATSLIFSEDFSDSLDEKWVPFGSPQGRVVSGVGNPAPAFDNNGDASWDSGAYTSQTFDYSNGLEIAADMYVPSAPNGCWVSGSFGVAQQSSVTGQSYDLAVEFRYNYNGSLCNSNTDATLWAIVRTADGDVESIREDFLSDYLDAWHRYRIVIRPDQRVEFYVDDSLIYRTERQIDPAYTNRPLVLGRRSSSYGKVYHDNIVVRQSGASDLAPPTGLVASAGDGQVELSWEHPGPDIDGYHVYRSTEPFETKGQSQRITGSDPVTETSYTDTEVANETTYYYRMASVRAPNISGLSEQVTATPGQTDLSNGLVAYYPFDGDASDASGNGNDGVVNGAVLAAGRSGGPQAAYAFDGVDDYIEITSPNRFDFSAFTVAFWAKSDGNGGSVLTHGEEVSSDNAQFGAGISQRPDESSGRFFVKTEDGADRDYAARSTTAPQNDRWYYVVGRFSEDGNLDLFLDGALEATANAATTDIDASLWIGAGYSANQSTLTNFWDGMIDDVRIYNRPLSESEIASLYNSDPEEGILPPSGLNASAGNGQVELSWEPSGANIDGYHVYRSTSPFSDLSEATKLNSSLVSETSFTDTGVTNGTEYFYRVTAVDGEGNESSPSSQVSAIPSTEAGPAIVVAPGALEFGTVEEGDSETKVFLLENEGDAVLEGEVGLAGGDGAFAIESGAGSYSLEPDETFEVEVTFAPEGAGDFEGIVEVAHNAENAEDPIEVALSGEGGSEDPPSEPVTELIVGGLTITAPEIVPVSGDEYEISGTAIVNELLQFDGTLTVDTGALTLEGEGLIFMEDMGPFDEIGLYDGSFTFSVVDDLLEGTVIDGTNTLLEMADLLVELKNIELLDDGVRLDGTLELPEVFNNLEVNISTVQITQANGLDLAGEIQLENVGIYSIANLETLALTFDTIEDVFVGEGKLVTAPATISAGTSVIGGRVNSMSVFVRVGAPVPLGTTGLSISAAGGSIGGLADPPISLGMAASLVPTAQGGFNAVEFDSLAINYDFGGAFRGSGFLKVFDRKLAGAYFESTPRRVGLGGFVDFRGVLIGSADAAVYLSPSDKLNFEGGMTAELVIPEGETFPLDFLSGALGLPYAVAQTENYIHNTSVWGNVDLELALGTFGLGYDLEWDGSDLDASFSGSYRPFNIGLFGQQNLIAQGYARTPGGGSGHPLEGQSLRVSSDDGNPRLEAAADTLEQSFFLDEELRTLVIRVEGEQGAPSYALRLPDGTTINPDAALEREDLFYSATEDLRKAFYVIESPSQGPWRILLPDSDTYLVDVFGADLSPSVEIEGVEAGSANATIDWSVTNPSGDATVNLYYDRTNRGTNGVLFAEDLDASGGSGSATWSFSDVPPGDYYVYATVFDEGDPVDVAYSQRTARVPFSADLAPPLNLDATSTDTSIVLTWDRPSGQEAKYRLYYDRFGSFAEDANVVGVGDTTTVTLTSLNPGRTYHFALTATGEQGDESERSEAIAYEWLSGQNNTPTITTTALPPFAFAGTTYSEVVEASDPDGDPLTYNLKGAPEGMSVSDSGALTWSPADDQGGIYPVTVEVADSDGLTDTASYDLRVLDEAARQGRLRLNSRSFLGTGSTVRVQLRDQLLSEVLNELHEHPVQARALSSGDVLPLTAQENTAGSGRYSARFALGGGTENSLDVASTDSVVVSYERADGSVVETGAWFATERSIVGTEESLLDMGEVRIQRDATKPLSLRAASTSTRAVTGVARAQDDWLAVDEKAEVAFELSPGEALTLSVTASGNEKGPLQGTILIEHDALDVSSPLLVDVTGTVVLPYPSDFGVTATRVFDDATDERSYRLVGLPGQIDADIAETLPGEVGSTWRAFRETGAEAEEGEGSEAYLDEYDGSEAFRFAPGRGFWLLSREEWAVDETVGAVELTDEGLTTVPLHDGWNIFSNPLDQPVAWDETLGLDGNSGVTEALWQWDGSWQAADTLRSARTGEAYYLFNDGGLEALTLQHPAFVEDDEGILIAAAREERAELQLIAEIWSDDTEERQEAARLTLGHTAGDAIMHRLPPAHFAAAQLAARSDEVNALLGRLLNPRPDTGGGLAFDIELTGVAEGEAVYFRAEDFDAFEGDEIVLVNVATGARHDLRAHSASDPVRIRVEEDHLARASDEETGMLPLQLLIGDQAFVDEAAERPEVLTLGPVYPNPSSGEVTVEVAVPEAMDVRLELFNVLGQQVGLLHSGELPAGVHQMRWDGRTSSGAEAASGVYLIRLIGPDSEQHTGRLTRVR